VPEREVSEAPRTADLEQLESAYVMHRSECTTCGPEISCELGRRMEQARWHLDYIAHATRPYRFEPGAWQ
jgi:hypothetical protein